MRKQLVLTGISEEGHMSLTGDDAQQTTYWLIFNGGEVRIPSGEEQIGYLLGILRDDEDQETEEAPDPEGDPKKEEYPEGAQLFSVEGEDDYATPPAEAGEVEDGIGQV